MCCQEYLAEQPHFENVTGVGMVYVKVIFGLVCQVKKKKEIFLNLSEGFYKSKVLSQYNIIINQNVMTISIAKNRSRLCSRQGQQTGCWEKDKEYLFHLRLSSLNTAKTGIIINVFMIFLLFCFTQTAIGFFFVCLFYCHTNALPITKAKKMYNNK